MRLPSIKTLILPIALGGVLLPGHGSFAQDALGAGDALDANSQVGSGGRNQRSRTAPTNSSFRDRNYIVTDSVAGGRGFRGNVGYRASGDFVGNLGSDDSKGFRSYSALSDLIFITSPQQIDSFNIAQGTGIFEFRRDFSSLPEANNVLSARRLDDAQIRLDRSTMALSSGTLYATAVDPSDVGIVEMADGRYGITASPLEGLGTRSLEKSFEGYTLYDRALTRQQMAQDGLLDMNSEYMPFISDFDRARLLGRAADLEEAGQAPDEQLVAQVKKTGPQTEAYQQIVDRIAEKYADRTDVNLNAVSRDSVLRDMGNAMNRLEAQISPGLREQAAPGERVRNTDTRREGFPGNRVANSADATGATGIDPGADAQTPTEESEEEPAGQPEASSGTGGMAALSIEEMGEILRHRSQIGELSVTDKTRLARAVKQGEQALQEGRFFKAERRFDDALRINPGNPLLELARANAQIGAGLYLSAALTLKRAFVSNPEVIDSRFKQEMLPTQTRLELSVVSIRERLKAGNDLQGYGLTLAYIGVQLNDDAVVREGLEGLAKGGNESLERLLRSIWLDGKNDVPADAEPSQDAEEGDLPAEDTQGD